MGEIRFKEALKHTIELSDRGILEKPAVLEAYLLDFAPEDNAVVTAFAAMAGSHLFDELARCSGSKLQDEIEASVLRIRDDFPEKVSDEVEKALYYAFSLKKKDSSKIASAASIPVTHTIEEDIPHKVKPQPDNTDAQNVRNVQPADTPQPADVPQPASAPAAQTQITHSVPTYVQREPEPKPANRNGVLYMIIGALAAAVVMFAAMNFMDRSSKNNTQPEVIVVTAEPAASEDAQASEPAAETPVPEETKAPVSEYPKTGTVYIAANANPRRIIVRSTPQKLSDGSNDTGSRKYNGDRVTVYEIKQGSKYTWYRIGNNQWIAGNGSSFYVVYD